MGSQQTDSQPFADFLGAEEAKAPPADAPAAPPPSGATTAGSTASSADNGITVVAPSRTSSSSGAAANGSGNAGGNAPPGSGIGAKTDPKTGAAGNASASAAARKLKIALDRVAAGSAAGNQAPSAADAAALPAASGNAGNATVSSETSDGATQTSNSSDPAAPQDSSSAGPQSLLTEMADAFNHAGSTSDMVAPGGKPAADGKAADRSGRGDDGGVSMTATSAPADSSQTQAQANQQQAATPPAVANTAQPVAAVIVLNTVTDSPTTATPGTTINPQGSARGKPAITSAGTANVSAQDAKDVASASAQPTGANAGPAAQTNPKTSDASASPGQTAAANSTSNGSSSDPSSASSSTGNAQQQQAQPQPAGAPAAFAVAASAAQGGGGRAGQITNGGVGAAQVSGAEAPASGSALDAAATNGLPNFGVQSANAAPTPNMPPMPAAAVPIAGLAVAIVARARAGSNKFDIRLDPPELGRIDVRLDVDRNGQVTSHVTVDRADTLQLLQTQQPQLQRALEQAGLTTTNNGLQFTLRDQSFAGQNGAGGNNGQPPAPQLVIPDPQLAPIDTAQIYSRWNFGGGLDIRV